MGASFTGWIDVALLLVAAAIPLGYRLRFRKRAVPTSRPTSVHVIIGFAAGALALGHTGAVIGALGDAGVVSGGAIGLLAASLGFVLLLVQTGLGLSLRDPKSKQRAKTRRVHVVTAIGVGALVLTHVLYVRS